MQNAVKKLSIALGSLVIAASMVSCKKDLSLNSKIKGGLTTSLVSTEGSPIVSTESTTTASLYSLACNWNNRNDGTYTVSQAQSDYGQSINGWSDARMNISTGRLRTSLTKNAFGPDGGLVSWTYVPTGSEYEMQFDMMFDQNFDFSWGGKVGFGFLIGNGYTGGENTTDGKGASARIMWYKNYSNGPVFLKPYLYYRDQPGTYGNDFGKAYPSNGTSITKGVWHTVKIYVKSNTGSNTDGRIKISINGTVLLDQAIRWTTDDTKRLVNRVTFETFRGGADASWASATDGQIYFDNLTWKKLAN